jgi:hypothetical protein
MESTRVENYGINLQKVRQEHLSTFASSKVKGFRWLFCSHALSVGTRLQGKKAKAAPTVIGQKTSGTWHSTAQLPNI